MAITLGKENGFAQTDLDQDSKAAVAEIYEMVEKGLWGGDVGPALSLYLDLPEQALGNFWLGIPAGRARMTAQRVAGIFLNLLANPEDDLVRAKGEFVNDSAIAFPDVLKDLIDTSVVVGGGLQSTGLVDTSDVAYCIQTKNDSEREDLRRYYLESNAHIQALLNSAFAGTDAMSVFLGTYQALSDEDMTRN